MKPGNDKETRARDFVRPIWGRENLLYWTRNWLPKNEYVFQLFWEASLFISYTPVSTARTLSQTFINFALPYRKLIDPHLRAPHWYMRVGRRYSFKGSSNSSAWKQECFFLRLLVFTWVLRRTLYLTVRTFTKIFINGENPWRVLILHTYRRS